MKIAQLPFNQNFNGWLNHDTAISHYPSFSGKTTADYVVIGAGYAGVACARRLAENNRSSKIILVEANDIENNASSRNSGFIIGLAHQISSSASELKKAEAYRRLLKSGVRQLKDLTNDNKIECDWTQAGKYYCIANPKFNSDLDLHIRELQSLNEPFTVFDQEALFSRLGTKFYQKGIYTDDGILINPAKLMMGLLENLPENVTVYEQSPVLSLENGQKVRVNLPYGEISASKVIITTNAMAGQLSPRAKNQVAMATFASFTEPLNEEQIGRLPQMKPWGILPINAIAAATLRYMPDNRFLVRQHVALAANGQINSNQTYLISKQHQQIFTIIFPNLSDVRVAKTWSGVISVTRNGAPIWGNLEPNIYAATGCNGSGISKQTVAGSTLADLVCNIDSPLVSDMYSLGQANYLPPSPILDMAVSTSLFKENFLGRSETGLFDYK